MKSLVEYIFESGHAYKKLKIQKLEQGIKELGDKEKYARDNMIETFDILANYEWEVAYKNVNIQDVIDLLRGSKFKKTIYNDLEHGLSFIVGKPSDEIFELLNNKDGVDLNNWDKELGGLFIRLEKTSKHEYLFSIFDIVLS